MALKLVSAASEDQSAQLSSLAARVRVVLEDEIASGVMPPGTRLDEVALSKRFAVSRTPIREALKQLDATGLVSRGPRRTHMVARIAASELDQLFELMGEMEAMCGRLAAIRMTPGERTELERRQIACRDEIRTGTPAGYAEADAAFHRAIYASTNNIFLVEHADQLRRRLAPFRRLQLLSGERLMASQTEHEVILNAILQGNADSAASACRRHIDAVRHAFGVVDARAPNMRAS